METLQFLRNHSEVIRKLFPGCWQIGLPNSNSFRSLPCHVLQRHLRSGMQHAVITGGTGSLGRAIAGALETPDWVVAAPGSRELDVSDQTAVSHYFAKQPADLLVCAAGITRDAPLARLSESAWMETWDVNFNGVLRCVEAALPHMVEKRAGHVVFISSFSALHPPIGQSAYASAKAALLGLVTDLAIRYGPSNIRVNAVLPGFLETRMTETVTERRKSEVLGSHVLGRFNTCAAVADFIRFLHHSLPHTSGQVFQLDSRVSGNFP